MNAHGSVGHNRPDYLQTVAEQMEESLSQYRSRLAEFVSNADRYIVRDRVEAGKAVDFIGMLNDVLDMVETARKGVSNPHHEARSHAIAIAERFVREALDARDKVQSQLDSYNQKRKALHDRQQGEQAELAQVAQPASREAIDYSTGAPAAGAATTARAPRKQQITGDYGYKQVEVTKMEVVVTDVTQVPKNILESEPVLEAIAKVVMGISKATKQRTMPGCKISFPGEMSIRS